MTKQTKPRLGRGLASLIGTPVAIPVAPPDRAAEPTPVNVIYNDDISPNVGVTAHESGMTVRAIEVALIVPSRFQPREHFGEAALAGLAASIRAAGVMQPVLVRRSSGAVDRWELVAGERRWRAAKLAGLERIPAVIVALDDQQAAEWALVENVQREDLSAMERARALRGLVDQFGMSHGSLGERVGLDRTSITNLIRLTELETEVQTFLSREVGNPDGSLSVGHGKALLGARPGTDRVALAVRAARESWSVRRLEQAVRDMMDAKASAAPGAGPRRVDPQISDIERQLGEILGTKVRLATTADRTRGRLIIEYYGIEHFEGVLRTLGVQIQS